MEGDAPRILALAVRCFFNPEKVPLLPLHRVREGEETYPFFAVIRFSGGLHVFRLHLIFPDGMKQCSAVTPGIRINYAI